MDVGRWIRLVAALALAAPALSQAEAPTAAPPARVRAWQTGMLAPDRLQHFSLSLTLGLGAGAAGARPAAVFAGVSLLGLGKELRDRHHSRFDPLDLAADVAGAGLAAWLTRDLLR